MYENNEFVLIVQSLDLQVKHSQLTLTQLNSLLRCAPSASSDPVPTPRPPLAAHCSHSPLQHLNTSQSRVSVCVSSSNLEPS